MNKLFTKITTALVGFAMAIGVGVAVASNSRDVRADASISEDPVKTLSCPQNTKNQSYTNTNVDITDDGITWNLNKVNQNANNDWRIGHKKSEAATNKDIFFYSKTAISSNIGQISVKYGAKNGTITVNSAVVYVYSTAAAAAAGTADTHYDSKNITFSANNTINVSPSAGKTWNNMYYRFTWNITSASASSARNIILKEVKFYEVVDSTTEATSMSISPSSLTTYAGEQGSFTPTLSGGSGDYEQTIGWVSNNTSVIASPSNSEAGSAVNFTPNSVITNTTVRITGTVVSPGSASAYIDVLVKPARTLSSIAVKTAPTTVIYNSGGYFDPTGLVITLTYDDASTVDVAYADASASFTFSPTTSTALTTSNTSVTITYGGKSTTQTISVFQTATYTVSSKTAASTSGSTPTSSSITYANSGSNNNDQMTEGNTETWTIKGYSGKTITSLKADLRRNGSSGSGTVSLTNNAVDSNSLLAKTTYAKGDLTNTYTEYELLGSGKSIEVKGDVVLTLTSSESSFWCDKIIVAWENTDTLSATLALSGTYPTTFTVGDSFSFGTGVATATYSETGSKVVTNDVTFKLAGSAISLGDTITSSMVGTKTVTVTYTDAKSNSASNTYSVTISYAAVTSVSISTSTSEMSKSDSFTFGATVLPSTANPDVTWSVADKVGTEVAAGNIIIYEDTGELTVLASDGCTITVTATTVGKDSSSNSKTASVDVVITGNPVVTVSSALAGYSGKNSSLAYSFGNFTGTLSVISSDTSKVTVGTPSATTGGSGSGTVQVNFVAAGSSTLTFKDGDTAVATCTVTVTASAVTFVGWIDSSDMTVYSGSTALNASKIASWGPYYEKNNGDSDDIESDYTVQLNGNAYTLGTALEAGTYTVTLTYQGVTSSSDNPTVTVIQSLNTISKTNVSDLTFSAACGGTGTADDGASWTITSDADESAYDADKGIHYGTSSAAVEYIQLVSNSFTSGTITKVVVNASGAKDVTGSISVTVGGNAFGTTASFNSTATNYTFTGNASAGQIIVRLYKDSAATKAIYCKSVKVTNIVNASNNTSHYTAQAAVVEFAQYMNTQMNAANVCTGTGANLATAWSNVSSKYTALFGASSTLSETELAYAKDMLANATASWNESHDSDEQYCLEKAMKTYEWCVTNRGCTAFMSAVRPLTSARVTPISLSVSGNSNVAVIIAVISIIGLTTLAGYFYLKKGKKKEENQ